MILRWTWVLLACCSQLPAWGIAQVVAPDPVFSRVPFDQWVEQGAQGPFHWSARVIGATLSNHQRLRARVEVTIDGADLVSRREHGYFVMMVQIQDSDNRIYQNHRSLNLQRIVKEAAKADVVYTQDVFVRPGDFRVAIAIFDSQTTEHGATQKTLHVNPLKNDPLPDAWLDLPVVEFVPGMDLPDSLYLPYSRSRLRLPVASRRPIHVELIVNVSPTRTQDGLHSGPANNRYWYELLPALKVMSQMNVQNGGLRTSLIDLTRREVVFDQARPGNLGWMRLRQGLAAADPNKIDVRSLEHREQNAQFFVEQIRERILAPTATGGDLAAGRPRVGIVLSGPMGFESGEDTRPIPVEGSPECKMFYFRLHMVPPPQLPLLRARRNLPPRFQEPLDSLVNLIKPLRPRLFDIYNPDQFRKALNTMLEEIARL